jgi:serine/threonine-protein kinase
VKTCTTCGAEWPDDTKFCPSDGSPLRAADGTSLIGGVIAGRFHILEKLGEGGMGAVYLGEHVKMGRKSAIKVLTEALAQDTEAIARFNREAANAARITHPNVCAIYDFGETDDGLIYLAMEFIEGEALTDLLNREGPLGPYRAAAIIKQAGDALQAAHDLGIVHRDLKPDNIMITQGRGGDEVVKVVDFGIAKAMGGEEGQKVTRTGLVVGTPEYMSPEQLSGDVLDGRSDIYSLALVLYRMLTGRLPFEAESAQEVMIKRLTDEPLKLNEALVGGNFPAKLQQVMEKALQRMPADRYVSASEFAGNVAEAVAGEPSTARVDRNGATQLLGGAAPSSADERTTERLPKTRVSAAKPTIPMEKLREGGRKTATPETPMPRPSVGQGQKSKRGRKTPVMALAASAVIVLGGGTAAVIAMSGNGGTDSDAGSDSLQSATVPPESTAANTDSIVQSGTPPGTLVGRPQGADSQAVRPIDRPAGDPGGADTGTQVADPDAVIDEATIERELIDLGRIVIDEPSRRPSVRQRLMEIYGTASLSAVLRGRAASIMSESYESDDMTMACTWIDRAISTDPGNDRFRMYKQTILSCQP